MVSGISAVVPLQTHGCYNRSLIGVSELLASLLDLSNPESRS